MGIEPNEQQPQFQQAGAKSPDNYLVWAILSTILCCLPLGIVSIVKATQVNTKLLAGDMAGAQQASADAKKWAIITAVVGIVVYILYFAFFGFAIFSAVKSGQLKSY